VAKLFLGDPIQGRWSPAVDEPGNSGRPAGSGVRLIRTEPVAYRLRSAILLSESQFTKKRWRSKFFMAKQFGAGGHRL